MDSQTRSHLLHGTLKVEAIPKVPSRVIKVFLCSTSTDTLQERNLLVENVYPKLREYSREKYGLEFEVVDPRWGIKDETYDDHSFTERSLQQLQQCCDESAGPYFVALVGQKYGRRPLPATIRCDVYENMKTLMRRHRSRETRDAGLLDQWYKRDENAIPPVYRLQPISSRFPGFISKDPEERMEAKKCWEETEVVLKRLMKKGLDLCVIDGKVDEYSRHQLMMSDLEREVQLCMMQQGDPNENCLVFYRNIDDLKNYMDHARATKFMEVTYNEREEKIEEDKECQNLLNDLKERKIKTQWLRGKDVEEFSVLWRFDGGINPKLHEQYLTAFSVSFLEKMTHLIDIHAERLSQGYELSDELYDELSQHLAITKAKAADCSMRESTMEEIKGYLCGKSEYPLTLYGEEGVGKATLMAAAHSQIPEWLGEGTHVISLYIGLTTFSSNIRNILLSICHQLTWILGEDATALPKHVKGLQSTFQDLLARFPSSKHLVIMLDSLERLSADDNAHFMKWLPPSLKDNVKVILSTLPEAHGILNRLQTEVYSDAGSYLEVTPLTADACLALVSDWLEADERTLTEEQQDFLGYVFQSCSSPTFARLICADAKTWPSWFVPTDAQCFKTLEESAGSMLSLLETRYGTSVIERALAYLVAADTGLSDCEMVDLLSLDDDVLAEVYTTWHPPVRRCPPMLWMLIKSEMSPFLRTGDRDGVTVCDFNHILLKNVAANRYLGDEKKTIHFNLADYFLGNWHGKKKPFLIPLSLIAEKKLPISAAEADRLVPAQPLTFKISDGFNRRKYDQVPRHLYLSGRLDELNMLVLFNYEWLYNKAKALSLQHILQDFSLNPSIEAQLVEEALRAGQAVIEANINNMAAEIVGRLLSYYQSHQLIRELINQSDKTGLKHSALIPAYPYHHTPGSPLQFTLNCETAMDFFNISNDGRYLLCKKVDRSIVRVFDLATGEHKTDIPVSVGDLNVTPDGRHFVLVDHVTRMVVKIHDAETGQFIGQLIPANHISLTPREKYSFGNITISNDYICIVVSAETSYLCIADVKTCKFLHIVGLESKGTVCKIMPDNKFVICNAGPNILSYNLETLEHVGSARYEKKPMMMEFTSDGSRGFWIDGQENKVTVMHLKNGCVEMSYRIVLDHSMPMDRVSHIEVSNEDKYLMVRGTNNILAYDIRGEKVVVRCQRPTDIPKEFRLPQSHSVDMCFTHAAFSRDNKYIIGAIFRNIYIWHINGGQLATTLQAPVGVIKQILVNKHSSQIISYLEKNPSVHVWNVEEAMYDIRTLDKLTRDIVEVKVTKDDKTCFVRCHASDEVGVIDMNTGALTDLLTHDGVVTNLAITPNGQYAFVATDTRKPQVTNKVWYVPERRLVYEFGSEPAYGVSTATSDAIYVIYHQPEGPQPTFIKKLCLDEDTVREINYTNMANRVIGEPFLTPDDQRLVMLTEGDKGCDVFTSPIISVLKLCQDYSHTMDAITISPDHLQTFVNVKKILDVRPCYYKPNILIILYDTEDKAQENGMVNGHSGCCKGLLLMDLETETVAHVCDSFLSPATDVGRSLLFSRDMRICLDKESNVYDIETGFFINQLHPGGKQPIGLALGGSVAIFKDQREVYALRVEDGVEIARCNIQGDITCVSVGNDEHTIVIGCADGRVVSHVLIDEKREHRSALLKKIASRQFPPPTDGRASTRSWDKVDLASEPPYSRPTSGISLGIQDKELLRKIKPVPRVRPKSDTLLYMNAKSTACRIM